VWERNALEESDSAFIVTQDGDYAVLTRRELAARLSDHKPLCESLKADPEAEVPFLVLRSIEEVIHFQESRLAEMGEVSSPEVLEEALKAQRLKRQSASERSKGRSGYRKNKGSINRKRKRLRKTPGFKRRQVKLARMKRGRSAGARRRFVVAGQDATANLSEGIRGARALFESADSKLESVWGQMLPLQMAASSLAESLEAIVCEAEDDDLEAGLGSYPGMIDEINRKLEAGELTLPMEAVEAMKGSGFLVLVMQDGVVTEVMPFESDEEAFDKADDIFTTTEAEATAVYDSYANEVIYFNSDDVDVPEGDGVEESVQEARLATLRLASDLRESVVSCNNLKRLDEGASLEETEVKSVLAQIAGLCESACSELLKAQSAAASEGEAQ
jgi:hypothetical protein